MNDILLAGTKNDEIANLKSKLHANFDMKDLGDASHILGIHIVQNREKKLLFLSQLELIGKVLMHFNMEGGKVWSTPLFSYVKLSLNDYPKCDAKRVDMVKVPYCSCGWQSYVCNDLFKAKY